MSNPPGRPRNREAFDKVRRELEEIQEQEQQELNPDEDLTWGNCPNTEGSDYE